MAEPFDARRHGRYWERCFKSVLPHQYTSNDSTRMTLGCFIIAAIDVLSPSLDLVPITPADRRKLRAWVLACQHPGGGFIGGPTHMPSSGNAADGFDFATSQPIVGSQGSANLAATFFALQLLALLADDSDAGDASAASAAFLGVNRAATLHWLRHLQRDDGSFGEILGDVVGSGPSLGSKTMISGGSDMRYCYMAAAVRWMLRGETKRDSPVWVEDINVDALRVYVHEGQAYDGGFGESFMHESHAGYTFCALSALALLERSATGASSILSTTSSSRDMIDVPALLHWLVSRQLACDPNAEDDSEGSDDDVPAQGAPLCSVVVGEPGWPVGFNGRCNKPPDTCYTWWVTGALAILDRGSNNETPHISRLASRQFLLEKTQHRIGGFSKSPGGPPDLYHSYLGLAALATMGEPGIKSLDPQLCVSADAVRKIQAARAGLLRAVEQRRKTVKQSLSMIVEALQESKIAT